MIVVTQRSEIGLSIKMHLASDGETEIQSAHGRHEQSPVRCFTRGWSPAKGAEVQEAPEAKHKAHALQHDGKESTED